MDFTMHQNIQFMRQIKNKNKNKIMIKGSRLLSILISILSQNLVLFDSLSTVALPKLWLRTLVPSRRQVHHDFLALRHFQKSKLVPGLRS